MLNHILIPLDGSLLAEEALEFAQRILKGGEKITLVTAVDMPENLYYGVHPMIAFDTQHETIERILPEAKDYLNKKAKDLREAGYEVNTVIKVGAAADVIVDSAIHHKVDTIAMSTHGRSGVSRWLFGSVTSKVLSAAPCPVLVVPSRERIHAVTKDTEGVLAKVD